MTKLFYSLVHAESMTPFYFEWRFLECLSAEQSLYSLQFAINCVASKYSSIHDVHVYTSAKAGKSCPTFLIGSCSTGFKKVIQLNKKLIQIIHPYSNFSLIYLLCDIQQPLCITFSITKIGQDNVFFRATVGITQ